MELSIDYSGLSTFTVYKCLMCGFALQNLLVLQWSWKKQKYINKNNTLINLIDSAFEVNNSSRDF